MLKVLRLLLPSVTLGAVMLALFPAEGYAIPPFSRKYSTSCQTCHSVFPKLNDFGKAFKDAGFKFPTDDETFVKNPPVLLGSEASKDSFPKSVWPGEIPGMPPIGLRYNHFFQVTSNADKFNVLAPPGSVPGVIPTTDFQSGLFSIFTAGNLGSDIAFWVDDDISVAGDNSAGGLGDAYLKFVNIGRFLNIPKNGLALRAGQFELDLPFTQARSINLSPYDIYVQTNVGATNPGVQPQHNVANQLGLADAAKGIELSGGHLYGGYHYSFAIFDQNTTGVGQSGNNNPYVPSATGGANGGVGFASDSSTKNIYLRFSYRFNLEQDPKSRQEIQAAGPTGPRDHTYLSVGTFYLHGNSLQQLPGVLTDGTTSTVLVNREPYYRVGGDFSFNYGTLNVYGLFMHAQDTNMLPVDVNGTPIPLPLGANSPLPAAFVQGASATFSGGFVQADYLMLPWVMPIMRWDQVNSTADHVNGLTFATNTPYFAPYDTTRNRFTPGIQVLIHANIKVSFEYQIRPQQFATVTTLPSGAVIPGTPFRANTALFALEFVY